MGALPHRLHLAGLETAEAQEKPHRPETGESMGTEADQRSVPEQVGLWVQGGLDLWDFMKRQKSRF